MSKQLVNAWFKLGTFLADGVEKLEVSGTNGDVNVTVTTTPELIRKVSRKVNEDTGYNPGTTELTATLSMNDGESSVNIRVQATETRDVDELVRFRVEAERAHELPDFMARGGIWYGSANEARRHFCRGWRIRPESYDYLLPPEQADAFEAWLGSEALDFERVTDPA